MDEERADAHRLPDQRNLVGQDPSSKGGSIDTRSKEIPALNITNIVLFQMQLGRELDRAVRHCTSAPRFAAENTYHPYKSL